MSDKWKGIVARSFSPEAFETYVNGIVKLRMSAWKPQFVVLHNTSEPSLEQRPNGLAAEHIRNLEEYYRDTKKWSAGPHLFIDDRVIWAFTPLWMPGVHSPSWNEKTWGVEMLGEFDSESATEGRGARVVHNAVCALATLHKFAGLDSHSLRLHREDPKTTHKSCPGDHIDKVDVINRVHDQILRPRGEKE